MDKIIIIRVGIPFTCLTLTHYCACPKSGAGFQCHMSCTFLCLMVVVRGGCSFCWYWWNCSQSLFKLSFKNENSYYVLNIIIFGKFKEHNSKWLQLTRPNFINMLVWWYIHIQYGNGTNFHKAILILKIEIILGWTAVVPDMNDHLC